MKPITSIAGAALALAAIGLALVSFHAPAASVAPASAAPHDQKATLCERLGGQKAIEAVTDEFVKRLTADARVMGNEHVKTRLAAIDVPSLRMHLINQLVAATGGQAKYTGRDMRSSHAGLLITKAEWNASVEDLVAVLDQFKVPAAEKGELLALLGPFESQIVQAPSLYTRIGGLKSIEAVTDDFLARLIADPRLCGPELDKRKAAIDLDVLRMHVINYLCVATGGPCSYTGRDMKSSHAGLALSEAHWNASVEDLVATLDKFKVPEAEKKEILALISPLKTDIVTKR